MPRPKKNGWGRVTITISDETAYALRVLAAIAQKEMGEVADDYMRRGGVLDGVSLLPHRQHPQAPPAFQAPQSPRTSPPPPPAAPGSLTGKDEALVRLLTFLQDQLKAGTFSRKELMAAMTPPLKGEGFHSGWVATGKVPAKHAEGVVRFLQSKGFQLGDISDAVKPSGDQH